MTTHTFKIETLIDLPHDDTVYRCVQGGGSDGKYAYYVMNDGGSEEFTRCRLLKYDLKTWTLQCSLEDQYYNHANDICYDAARDQMVICHNQFYRKRISYFDRETLENRGLADLDGAEWIFAVDYNKKRGQYVIGMGGTYDTGIADDTFRLQSVLPGIYTGYVKQGMYCDDDTIYYIFSVPNLSVNYLYCYDWDGELKERIQIPIWGECENIFKDGDSFILGFNCPGKGCPVYRVTID